MICAPCRRAADQRLGRAAHCDDPKCMCGHEVEKYGTTMGHAPVVVPTVTHIVPADYLADPIINLGPLIAGYEEALAESGCTATITSMFGTGTVRCTQPAGHYDERTEPDYPSPGGWHLATDPVLGPKVWSDWADGATPHTEPAP